MTTPRDRSALAAGISQTSAAALLGAWVASIFEPPEGVAWGLLAGAVALAAAAGYLHQRGKR